MLDMYLFGFRRLRREADSQAEAQSDMARYSAFSSPVPILDFLQAFRSKRKTNMF